MAFVILLGRIGVAFIFFLAFAKLSINIDKPYLENVDIEFINVTNINNDTLTGPMKLLVRFIITNNTVAYPEMGTYILSQIVNQSQTVNAYSTSTYKVVNGWQLVKIRFVANQTRVQKQQTRSFQQRSVSNEKQLRLRGDFKIRLLFSKAISFPDSHYHIYFDCDIKFIDDSLRKMIWKECIISKKH